LTPTASGLETERVNSGRSRYISQEVNKQEVNKKESIRKEERNEGKRKKGS